MKALHLCIDMQPSSAQELRDPRLWGALKSRIPSASGLLARKSVPTVYVGLISPGFPFFGRMQDTPAFGRFAFVKEYLEAKREVERERWEWNERFDISVGEDSLVVAKRWPSAHTCKALVAFVERGRYDTLLLSGIFEPKRLEDTNVISGDIAYACVSATACDFAKENPHLQVIVLDGLTNIAKRDDSVRSIYERFGVRTQSLESILPALGTPHQEGQAIQMLVSELEKEQRDGRFDKPTNRSCAWLKSIFHRVPHIA